MGFLVVGYSLCQAVNQQLQRPGLESRVKRIFLSGCFITADRIPRAKNLIYKYDAKPAKPMAIFNDPMFLPTPMQHQFSISSSPSLFISSPSSIGSSPSSPVSISSTSSSREVLLTGFEIRGFSPSRMGRRKVASATVQSWASSGICLCKSWAAIRAFCWPKSSLILRWSASSPPPTS